MFLSYIFTRLYKLHDYKKLFIYLVYNLNKEYLL